ncbi:MAG: DUF4847 family protein [Phocaeicola sp.]|uniref:DUF4847 family protein n=1 Tax=Phocaeicola TaxID=909656 RepID=UPI00234EC644|nr:DUF4847 family protein [Phocaeicola oris]MCE2615666.1 DUF4847 family protein [Phocaeicola oris]
MMKIKQILLLLLIVPFFCNCSTKDDVNEIFISGTWTVVNFFTTSNWNNTKKAIPEYTSTSDIAQLKSLKLTFNEAGSFIGSLTNGTTFDGTWTANGSNRTITFPINIKTSGTLNKMDREFINALQNAKYYKGDSKTLLIGNNDKNSYVQLTHYNY